MDEPADSYPHGKGDQTSKCDPDCATGSGHREIGACTMDGGYCRTG